jgi:hypothetical protein
MIIQSRINSQIQRQYRRADSIGMDNKISQIKSQKKKLKTRNPRSPNQNYHAHKLMR